MARRPKTCEHIFVNGSCCEALALRNSRYCYWHLTARDRQQRRHQIGGPISADANTGVALPLLEDANSIQIAVEELMHGILDRRIDNRRAGLLLYALQIATSNRNFLEPSQQSDETGSYVVDTSNIPNENHALPLQEVPVQAAHSDDSLPPRKPPASDHTPPTLSGTSC